MNVLESFLRICVDYFARDGERPIFHVRGGAFGSFGQIKSSATHGALTGGQNPTCNAAEVCMALHL